MNTRLCSERARRALIASIDERARPCSTGSARRSTEPTCGRRAPGNRSLREVDALVSPRLRVLPALERWRRGAEDHRTACALGERHRGVASRVAQPFLLLERGVVLLIDDDQSEPRHRPKHGEARAEHDPRVAFGAREPRRRPCDVFQAAVHDCDVRIGERAADSRFQLRGQADFRDEHQRLRVAVEHAGDQVLVNLGFAAAGDTVQQERAKRSERRGDPPDRR
jgi:hypothetical protein